MALVFQIKEHLCAHLSVVVLQVELQQQLGHICMVLPVAVFWQHGEDDKLLSVVAAKVCDTETMQIDEEIFIDVSSHVYDGVLYWDLPG